MSWQTVKLGDIIEIKKGSYITKKESKVGPYPVILGGQEPAYYIDKFNHTGKAIVISRSGASAGFVSFWNEPIFVTDGFLIEPQETVKIDFLYYLLKSHQFQLQGQQGGSAIPHVNPRIINAIEVRLPSLSIQDKVVSILSAYDDLIENNQKQIKLLEEAAQRLYKEWFVDLRFHGWEDIEIVDGVPVGWKKVQLSELCSVLRRGISPKYSEKGKYQVINQKCIRTSIMDMSEARRQEKDYAEELNLRDADTVICSTGTGTLGRVGQVYGEHENTTLDSHVTLVRSEKHPNYIYHSVKNRQSFLMGMGRGSTNQQELYRGVIETLEILVPSDEIIISFETIATNIHKKTTALVEQIERLTYARDRLLPKLMSGELEV